MAQYGENNVAIPMPAHIRQFANDLAGASGGKRTLAYRISAECGIEYHAAYQWLHRLCNPRSPVRLTHLTLDRLETLTDRRFDVERNQLAIMQLVESSIQSKEARGIARLMTTFGSDARQDQTNRLVLLVMDCLGRLRGDFQALVAVEAALRGIDLEMYEDDPMLAFAPIMREVFELLMLLVAADTDTLQDPAAIRSIIEKEAERRDDERL